MLTHGRGLPHRRASQADALPARLRLLWLIAVGTLVASVLAGHAVVEFCFRRNLHDIQDGSHVHRQRVVTQMLARELHAFDDAGDRPTNRQPLEAAFAEFSVLHAAIDADVTEDRPAEAADWAWCAVAYPAVTDVVHAAIRGPNALSADDLAKAMAALDGYAEHLERIAASTRGGIVTQLRRADAASTGVTAAVVGIATLELVLLLGPMLRMTRAHLDRLNEQQRDLAAANDRLALALSGGGLGLWDWHIPSGRCTFDEGWAAMLGEPVKALKQDISDWTDRVHPADLPLAKAALDAHFRGDAEYYECEHRLRARDGSWKWILDRGRVTERDAAGNPVRVVGTHADVTARHAADAALRDQRLLLETCIANTPAAVAMLDRDLRYVAVSRLFTAVYGLGDQTLIGRWHYEVFPDLPQKWRDVDRRALAGEHVSRDEDELTHPDGRVDYLRWTVLPWHNAAGEVGGILIFSQVITDQVLARKAAERARAEAEEANLAKTRFLANISHELRTPLTSILGFADNLARRDLPAPADHEAVGTIARNGRHLLQLINDLLDVSKIEAGKMAIEQVECDLPALVAEIAADVSAQCAARGLQLNVSLRSALPRLIRSDPTRLRQVLLNLLHNAVKFTPHGSIALHAHAAADGLDAQANERVALRFHVIDTGIGMSHDEITRLFRPFTQADTSVTRRFGGTGLGLTISRRLSELLGGGIEVRSEPGRGSEFVASVRATVSAGTDWKSTLPQPMVSASAPLGEQTTALSGVRVLLAEDAPDVRRWVTFVLGEAGAIVDVAENGLEAAERLAAGRDAFDLVLMDMQMPVMDGPTATARMRRQGYRGPILALTANAMADDVRRCLDAGCDTVLTKPIARQNLLAALATAARGRPIVQGEGIPLPSQPVSLMTPPPAHETQSPAGPPSAEPAGPLVSEFAGDEGMAELVREYVQTLPARVAALESQLSAGLWEPLARTLHQVKGSGGGYGFSLLSQLAAVAERHAREQNLPAAGESTEALVAAIRRVDGYDRTLESRPTPATPLAA
jgi:PAS domain S-box-containing protein